MLLPGNASRLVRLHRLAALGMAIADDSVRPLSSSAVRALLKRDDIGGSAILSQEDPYSDILIQSITFFGGDYLVSPGSGEHTVADVENLADAAFREDWMPKDLRGPIRQLVQGLLTVSNLVLTRAGMHRGTRPGREPGMSIEVPSAARLEELADCAFLTREDLHAHGDWLSMVVDTFALDPGELNRPCTDDVTEDRLIATPFLRLPRGYQVVVPLDLLSTIRYHLLRFAYQAEKLEELGKRYRAASVRRIERLVTHGACRQALSQDESMDRYLFSIDSETDVHVMAATDNLADWSPDHVWGMYDTGAVLEVIRHLIQPEVRRTYSTAESLLHLVIIDSPGRAAFWGVPNVDGADPVLMARADDIEVMLHREQPNSALGLLYFAEAKHHRPGNSIATNVLDEYSAYEENDKSFYFSDGAPPTFTVFEAGDGFFEREKFLEETDRHGVEVPIEGRPIVQASRRYNRDTPEIFVIDSTPSFFGYVVELGNHQVFVSPELHEEAALEVAALLLEAVAFWIRECLVVGALTPASPRTHLVVESGPPSAWTPSKEAPMSEHPVDVDRRRSSALTIRFSDLFVTQLQVESNIAERNLVAVLLTDLFAVDQDEVGAMVNLIAPLGPKRMLNVFNEDDAPKLRSDRLPAPLTGHGQVSAQILDELGDWLTDPAGAGFTVGPFAGRDRSLALNRAVDHLFQRMEAEISQYDQRALLDYLIAQNEALIHFARRSARMLRSYLACFGSDAETSKELVQHRRETISSHRANRFLIEYVAAQPPGGDRLPTIRGYYLMLGLAQEITERGTASDFLHYGLADFEVSILKSGRLGVNRDEPVKQAIETYSAAAGARAIRTAIEPPQNDAPAAAWTSDIVHESADAMRAEFGFTLSDLGEVCGGLLDVGVADQVTRVARSDLLARVATARNLDARVVETVLNALTLSMRDNFMSIGNDAAPWRFNRKMSYVRRPLVLQGEELVYGFRSVLDTVPYWSTSLISGRLQATAKTQLMKAYISRTRRQINDRYAAEVAERLRDLGLTTELSVTKIAGTRITDAEGLALGDIDVLAWHDSTRTVLVVEAKDFEIARTPAEMSHEMRRLFLGKQGKKPERSTVEKHARRMAWIRANLAAVLAHVGADVNPGASSVVGVIVTSDPLVTPLVASSRIPVISFSDLDLDVLGLEPNVAKRTGRSRR